MHGSWRAGEGGEDKGWRIKIGSGNSYARELHWFLRGEMSFPDLG